MEKEFNNSSSSSSSSSGSSSMSSGSSDDQHVKVRTPLSPLENLAVGALGGAIETTIQMPIITYKFCAQEGRALPKTFPAWYRGVFVQAGTVAPITAIQFMINGMFQRLILSREETKRELTDVETIGTACAAGAVSAIVYSPVDLITIQQQKLNQNPFATAKYIIQQRGYVHGLFRGFSACAIREAIYTAGYLGLAPVLTHHLLHYATTRAMMDNNNNNNDNTTAVVVSRQTTFLAGICGACGAGLLAALATHPVDTVKTCVQSDLTKTIYPTARKTASILMQQQNNNGTGGGGGISNFFKGLIPRSTRVCGAFFICMSLREMAIDYKNAQP